MHDPKDPFVLARSGSFVLLIIFPPDVSTDRLLFLDSDGDFCASHLEYKQSRRNGKQTRC